MSSSTLLTLLDVLSKTSALGLPAPQQSVGVSEEELEELFAHIKREGNQETEEFLTHSLDVAQYHHQQQQMLWDELDKFINEYSAHVDPTGQLEGSQDGSGLAGIKDEQEEEEYTQPGPSIRRFQHNRYHPHLHQLSIPSNSRSKRQNFSREITQVLTDWLVAHYDHPYPSEQEKEALGQQVGLKVSQISGWFINARRRKLKKDPTTNTFNLCKK